MKKLNGFSVSPDQSPGKAEALRGKKSGDKMAIKAHITLKQQTNEGADFTLEA